MNYEDYGHCRSQPHLLKSQSQEFCPKQQKPKHQEDGPLNFASFFPLLPSPAVGVSRENIPLIRGQSEPDLNKIRGKRATVAKDVNFVHNNDVVQHCHSAPQPITTTQANEVHKKPRAQPQRFHDDLLQGKNGPLVPRRRRSKKPASENDAVLNSRSNSISRSRSRNENNDVERLNYNTRECIERSKLTAEHSEAERGNVSHSYKTTTHYNSDGTPSVVTKEESTNTNYEAQKKTSICWEEERKVRTLELNRVMTRSAPEAIACSQSFRFYRKQVLTMIRLFYEVLQNIREIKKLQILKHCWDTDHIWKDPLIIKQFVFGLPGWECAKETWPNIGEESFIMTTPWLACCWTLPELLSFCYNPEVIEHVITASVNHRYEADRLACEEGTDGRHAPYFMITTTIMTGYVTGHLLFQHIPELKALMRPVVLQEHQQPYFPTFSEFYLSCEEDQMPASLTLKYDFHEVLMMAKQELFAEFEQGMPEEYANGCNTCDFCYFIGLNVECDSAVLVLLSVQNMSKQCFDVVKHLALDRKPRQEFTAMQKLAIGGISNDGWIENVAELTYEQ